MENKTESNSEISEIDVDSISLEHLQEIPWLLDGFRPCRGCDTVFVLKDYCASCARMLVAYETQRRLQLQAAGRVDMGVVPFAELEEEVERAPRFAVALILFGALCYGMFLMTGLWYMGRGLIGICLEHSK